MRKQKIGIALFLALFLLIVPLNAFAATIPIPPSGLKATAISSSQISLTWEPVDSVSQYYIYRANQPNSSYTYIGVSSSTDYISIGLNPSTPYYYKVQAISNAGASEHSSEAWAVTLSGPAGSGNTNSSIGGERLAGADRYETAAKIAQAGWDASYYAIIASGENYPDALCSAPLAAKYNAPILLTAKNTLQAETKKQLLALDAKEAVIIGGVGVVSEKVAESIKDLGIKVTRIAGNDRYETSLKVAEKLGEFDEAVIASGQSYQDVLSIAPIAAKEGMPILLTPKDSLSADMRGLLNRYAEDTYVLGDTSSISNNVYTQLPSPERLTGSDWYEMNINIFKNFADRLDLSTVYITVGTAYPDALAGSTLASLSGSPMILVSNPLKQVTQNFLQDYSARIQKVVAFGGTGVISENLLDTIADKIGPADNDNLVVTNVTATPQSASQIYLTWNGVSNASAYSVYKSASYSGNYEKIATISSPYYSDTYLSTGTTYYYKIQAIYNTETGPFSDIVFATTLTVNSALTQPNNVKATLVNSNQVNLSWDTVSSALHYNVFRSTSPNGTYTNIMSVHTPYYTDTSLSSGITYYYKIQAVGSFSTSPYSSVVQAQTLLDGNVLAIPSNVEATTLSSSQIHVKWDSVTNATVYNVYRSTSLMGTYELVVSVITPFHIDTKLSPSTMYFYKIQPGNSAGVGNYSEVVYATTQYSIGNLGTPSNIKATPLSSSQIFLSWDAVNSATYYDIYRSTTSNGAYNKVETVSTPYFSDQGLSAKTTYYYRIQAGNNSTTGSQSSPVYGTTQ